MGKGLVAAGLLIGLSWGLIRSGIIPSLQANTLHVEFSSVDLGHGKGGIVEGTVIVRNASSHSIRLIGGTSNCACITTLALPADIGPGETLTLPVVARLPCLSPGVAQRDALIWTDDPQTPYIRFRLTYRCD